MNDRAARNVGLVSGLGTGNGDNYLLLHDVGWAKNLIVQVLTGNTTLQVSLTGEDTDWTSGGFVVRRIDLVSGNDYPLTGTPGLIEAGKTYQIGGTGPFAPFYRFQQSGGTAASVRVFLQG